MRRVPIINDAESLAKYTKSVHDEQSPEALQQRLSLKAAWWYMFGITPGGKPTIIGPKNTEAEVTNIGEELNLTGFQDDAPYTYELETIDAARATRQIKLDLMERGIDADKALRRARHR